MTKLIDQLKLVFLGVFAISCVAVWGYQWFVVGPQHRCEQAGNWWDPEGRQCGIVVDVRSFPRIAPPPHSSHPVAAPAPGAATPAASTPTAPATTTTPAPTPAPAH